MRPNPPTPANEALADALLDRLRGYTRRQDLVRGDRATLRALLDEWDLQVSDLQWRERVLQAKLEEQRRMIRTLQWRLATSPVRRLVGYLSFVTGFAKCPTP